MPSGGRVGDTTVHGGVVVGPGVATVMIAGMPAAIMGDTHACPIPANTGHLPSSPFIMGSSTVLIQGVPAVRQGDSCACGASIAVGAPTVMVG